MVQLSTRLCLFAYAYKKTLDSIDRIVATNVLISGKKPSSYIHIDNVKFSRTGVPPDEVSETVGSEGWDWAERWKQRKRLVIWRLVEMANSDASEVTRLKAIDTLMCYNLSDSEMSTVAQQSNEETAAALARCKRAEGKMFLKPIPPFLTAKELEEKIRDLLIELSKSRHHNCLKYFVSKAFPDYKTMSSYFFMVYETGETMKQVIKLSEDNIILSCLEALVHHCSIKDFAKDLVKAGGLNVLSSCYRLLGDQPQVSLLLSKLILSVSLHKEHIKDLHRTGWIGILSEWCRGRDTRLGSLGACALSNLDCLCEDKAVFGKELFLLHPRVRVPDPPADSSIDVIFLHGLLGGLFFTWRQRSHHQKHFTLYRIASNDEDDNDKKDEIDPDCGKSDDDAIESDYEFVLSDIPVRGSNDIGLHSLSLPWKEAVKNGLYGRCEQITNSWPMDWLARDCVNLRLIGTNYDTRLSTWLPRCPLKEKSLEKSISAQSDALLNQLAKANVGSRPLVWIAHSMGGLLLKYILIKASTSDRAEVKKLVSNTRAIVFLSTPHIGSPLANLSDTSRFLLQTPRYLHELRLNSPQLLKLHEDFLCFVEKYPIHITTFVETKSTKITSLNIEIQCVPPSIANPHTGEVFEIPVGHMDICKPDSKMSFIYQKILQIIKKVQYDSKEEPCWHK